MNTPVDPDDAQRALDDVAHRRRQVAVATRSPWWLYLAGFLLLVVLFVSRDFDRFGYLIIALGAVLMALLVLVPKRFPALAAPLGRGALAHRSLMTRSTRTAVVGAAWLAAMTAFAGSAHAADTIASSDAPHWIRLHPWTVLAVLPAALIIAVAWLLESWIVIRSTRSAGR
jgi:MFS superfamily sulfate permease-like transporter